MSEYVDTITIGSDGEGSITLDAGEYELVGRASGHESATRRVTLDSDQSITVELVSSADNIADFSVGPEGMGVDLESIADFQGATGSTAAVEGLAYDGTYLYTGEREGPPTIRQWNTDGTPTGETVEVPGGHTNTMAWYDGELWISSSETRETYIVDWSTQIVVETITHDGVVSNGAWRDLVEDSTGSPMFIWPIWRSDEAYIIDAAASRAEGSTGGNVVTELSSGFFHNPQTTDWNAGTCYTTTHEYIIAHTLPAVDQLNEGDPLYTENIDWVQPIGSGSTLEQIVSAGDGDVYLADRAGSGTLYHGVESSGTRSMGDFGTLGQVVSDSVPDGASYALEVTETGTTHIPIIPDTPTRGTVECWFYDDGSADKRVYPAITDTDGNATNIGVATHQSWGSNEYGIWDGEWSATGISRETGWHKFRWEVGPSGIDLEISKHGEGNWESAGTSSRDTEIEGLRLQRYAGTARIGAWDLSLRHLDASEPAPSERTLEILVRSEGGTPLANITASITRISESPDEILTVRPGETHTIPAGTSESYTEGTIESGGTLSLENGGELSITGADGGGETLTVAGGETHTISSGSTESYTETTIEPGGTLDQEDGSELHTTGE